MVLALVKPTVAQPSPGTLLRGSLGKSLMWVTCSSIWNGHRTFKDARGSAAVYHGAEFKMAWIWVDLDAMGGCSQKLSATVFARDIWGADFHLFFYVFAHDF